MLIWCCLVLIGHIIIADVEGANCRPELFDLGSNPSNGAGSFITRKLAFQEYSDHFPHKQFTVGFSGRYSSSTIYALSMSVSMSMCQLINTILYVAT